AVRRGTRGVGAEDVPKLGRRAPLNWPWSAAKRQKTIERQNDRTKNFTLARPVAFLPTRRKSRAPGSPARHRRPPSRTRLTAVIFSPPFLFSPLRSAARTGKVTRP